MEEETMPPGMRGEDVVPGHGSRWIEPIAIFVLARLSIWPATAGPALGPRRAKIRRLRPRDAGQP